MTRKGPRRTIAMIAALTIAGAMSAFVPGPVVATELAQSVVVSANPAGGTPNVQDGRVNSLAQVGDRIFAGGTFTTVRNTTSNGGQTYTRNRVFALDADSFVVDTGFVANVDGDVEAVAASPDGDMVLAEAERFASPGTIRDRVRHLLRRRCHRRCTEAAVR